MLGCKKDDEFNNQHGKVKYIEGNIYKTVRIGKQVWFAENLRTTKYNDGSVIPTGHSQEQWRKLIIAAYAWYNDNDDIYKNAYGALYNWHAVNTGKLCPKGWRVPSERDWSTLLSGYIGGEFHAGGKLKSSRTTPEAHPRWTSPNTGAIDEYEFSMLPGGCRSALGSYFGIGDYGTWWSSSEIFFDDAYVIRAYYHSLNVGRIYLDKSYGFSVRCLKNN